MIEFIRHAFGLCGEAHPSVLYFLIGAGYPATVYIVNKIRKRK